MARRRRNARLLPDCARRMDARFAERSNACASTGCRTTTGAVLHRRGNGRAHGLFRESDPYWINLSGDIRFLKDGKRLLWTSERDGFRHIFLYSIDGKDVKQVTKGDWEVTAIDAVDEAAGRVFYTSSEPTPPGARTLQRQAGWLRQARSSPRRPARTASPWARPARTYLDTWSSLQTPPRTVLRSGDGAELGVYREADRAPARSTKSCPPRSSPTRRPTACTLYARLIKPAGFQAGKKYPVVMTVYGGPGVALPVRNAWQGVNIDQVLGAPGLRGLGVGEPRRPGARPRFRDGHLSPARRRGTGRPGGRGEVPDLARIRRPGAHRHSRLELRRVHDRQRAAQRAGRFPGAASPARRSPTGSTTTPSTPSATWACPRTIRMATATRRCLPRPRT